MMSALLGGLSMIDDPEPTLIGASALPDAEQRGRIAGVFLVVVNPAAFGNAQHYQEQVREMVEVAKGVSPAPGFKEILIRANRSADPRAPEAGGVPLAEATWQDLVTASQRFGSRYPKSGSSAGGGLSPMFSRQARCELGERTATFRLRDKGGRQRMASLKALITSPT